MDFFDIAAVLTTWGDLRGGISVALALSLPTGAERAAILTITYIVMAFSIIDQKLSVRRLIKHFMVEHT